MGADTPSNAALPPRRKGAVLATALAIALALTAIVVASCSAANGKHRGGPALYWGAQIGPQLTGEQPPWDMNAAYKFEKIAGKRMSLLGFSAPFAKCGRSHCSFYTFPTTPMEDLREHGTIPFFSWSSASVSEGTHDPRFRLSKIIHGRYDHYIRSFARAAADWGHPFFLRFNWEMNGNWFPWSEGVNRNRRGQYVAAWRHVHRIFDSVGATNATWVWCPNVGIDHKYRQLYPGNKYVDWTCLDGYNWGTRWNWSSWKSFKRIFADSYRHIHRLAPKKPMVIGEIASTDLGGSKAKWIRGMFRSLRHGFKKVRGLVWFDVHDRGTGWPIETSRRVRRAFAAGIRSRAYKANVFGQISDSPIRPPRR